MSNTASSDEAELRKKKSYEGLSEEEQDILKRRSKYRRSQRSQRSSVATVITFTANDLQDKRSSFQLNEEKGKRASKSLDDLDSLELDRILKNLAELNVQGYKHDPSKVKVKPEVPLRPKHLSQSHGNLQFGQAGLAVAKKVEPKKMELDLETYKVKLDQSLWAPPPALPPRKRKSFDEQGKKRESFPVITAPSSVFQEIHSQVSKSPLKRPHLLGMTFPLTRIGTSTSARERIARSITILSAGRLLGSPRGGTHRHQEPEVKRAETKFSRSLPKKMSWTKVARRAVVTAEIPTCQSSEIPSGKEEQRGRK